MRLTPTVESSAASTTPDSTSSPTFAGSVSTADSSGYTYTVSYDVGSLGSPKESIDGSPPGYAALTAPVSVSIRVSNTTPGRQAPGIDELIVAYMYNDKRPTCTQQRIPKDSVTIDSQGYCTLELASGYAQNIPAARAEVMSLLTGEVEGVDVSVDEAQFDVVASDVSRPDYVVLLGLNPNPTCGIISAGTGVLISVLASSPVIHGTCSTD
ncbi:MAG TPA: hypothetical protein VHX38_31730 [Pseudonocardiaceae bacterium]|jgi:hypothetical protein|nr:hypothetical protein [Pseudonocardiaceae bacterium]